MLTVHRELKTEKFQMLMDKSTMNAVDDWGFANRIRTRAETIRTLIHKGIAASAQEKEKGDVTA